MKRRNFQKTLTAKQYQRGRFENPFFRDRKKKQRRYTRSVAAFICLVFLSIPIAVIASPFFVIDEVTIDGLTTIPEADVQQAIETRLETKKLNVLPERKSIFLSEEKLQEELMEQFDFARLEMEVDRKRIHVVVEEKISELVLLSNERMVFLDLAGTFLRDLEPAERSIINQRLGRPAEAVEEGTPVSMQPTMPIIYSETTDAFEQGAAILEPMDAHHVIAFDKGLRRLSIEPETYRIEEEGEGWMRVHANTSYDILFDGVEEPEEQLAILKVVLEEYEERLAEAQYIDIRFGNRVYIK